LNTVTRGHAYKLFVCRSQTVSRNNFFS